VNIGFITVKMLFMYKKFVALFPSFVNFIVLHEIIFTILFLLALPVAIFFIRCLGIQILTAVFAFSI